VAEEEDGSGEGEAVADPVEEQEEIGRVLLVALGIAVVGADGYEADDVIATLAARARERVEILSGDRDLFALVRDPDVAVLYPRRGTSNLEVIDEAAVTERYGIPGRAYGDYALLRGDPSDGLPGVRGIGEKTAARLIREHGSLDALLAATDLAPAIAKKLDAGREYLARAREVIPPVDTLDLPSLSYALPREPAEPAVVDTLATTRELAGTLARLREAFARAAG
jgi:5'-3' exonuclease